MPPKTETIWFDGRWVPWEEAKVHVLVHGLHYGTGAFEGMRCYRTPRGPAIFRLEDHLRRWVRSAGCLFLRIPYDLQDLAAVCRRVVVENGLEDGYVRPVVFYGLGGMNFSFRDNAVHVAIAVWPWGAYLGEDGMRRGIRVKTASWVKTSSNAIPSAAKIAGAYVNSCLAYQEAMRAGFDEALLLNDRGTVAEGTGENVFAIREGEILTPPASDHLVSGITRDSVMRLALDRRYALREVSLSRSDLLAADEVFLTGTAAEVTPVREIDCHPIGEGGAGPVTQELREAYLAAAHGEDPRYSAWLSYVLESPSRNRIVRSASESAPAIAD
ncbi:MAG TPA: branched-chain amino acid transaminase [Thermoplasmata archaeon]|jgi:branched-chain amino acid aminotransferase|nr:branched-chain amino acid transaminase [Thermoplasmata archaeon]